MITTFCYLTMRKEPMFEWFAHSLKRELAGNFADTRVVLIDYWSQVVEGWTQEDIDARHATFRSHLSLPKEQFLIVPPKPTVWQGAHRLTNRNFFAAANARNTGVCYAPDGWIVFVDDLSVLMPGWYSAVKAAIAGKYIVYGAYRKVLLLDVRNGEVADYKDHPTGWDTRWKHGSDTGPVIAAGSWLFGCSFACPVQAFLDINGMDECCDPIGGEDYCAGIMMERAGYQFRYDRRMLTLESEERHFIPNTSPEYFLRVIERVDGRQDASIVILNMVLNGGRNVAPNFFPNGGLTALRQSVLKGEPFPVSKIPEHSWYSGKPVADI